MKAHLASRWRRVATGFSSPRRIALSLFVVALAFLWLGQTLLSVLFREPWDADVFRRWVSLPLMGYFLWHIIRVAWKRPEDAIEWLPEEEGLIVGGPFTTTQILVYRVAVIFTATLPKALLTTLVLLPDLSWSGPVALLMALICLELFRLIVDLATSCLSTLGYAIYRSCVAGAIAVVMYSGYVNAQHTVAATDIASAVPVTASQQAAALLQAVRHGHIIQSLEVPFLLAADAIAGRGTASELILKLFAMLCTAAMMSAVIRVLYVAWQQREIKRERMLWQHGTSAGSHRQPEAVKTSLPRIPIPGCTGPLMWRQCKRAWRHVGSLLIAMGIPALLSCLPLFSIRNPMVAFVFVVCGVLFYTFVLLPEAIKFDFRLDSDHICQLRSLPMTSRQIVIGQLATPVLLAFLFQIAVISFAGIVRQIPLTAILVACGIAVPLTVIFVAIDNLVFLLYPHRPTQEGFEAFLRTILKFTGKSLLLALAGGVLLLWAPAAAYLSSATAQHLSVAAVFYTGICLGGSALAIAMVQMVVRAYHRFDVSMDVV